MNSVLEIPWKNFTEEELHLILETFFTEQGYNVYNVHRIQKSEEKGADLIISKSVNKIAIAVKIRPSNDDNWQLEQLSRRKEKHKIYIYVDDPTPQFKDEMKKKSKRVEFWNSNKLTEEFFRNNPYFATNILLGNLEYSQTLMGIRELFVSIHKHGERKRKIKVGKLNNSTIIKLWRLKDDSVAIHKTFKNLQPMFENLCEQNLDTETQKKILSSFIDLLNSVEVYAKQFFHTVDKFFHENEDAACLTVKETLRRSNWVWIFGYNTLSTGNIEYQYNEWKTNRDLLAKIIKERLPKETSSIIDAIKTESQSIQIFSSGIEAFIDDFFETAFNIPRFKEREIDLNSI